MKEEASWNIPHMVVTLPSRSLQAPRSWLNFLAKVNMLLILVTLSTLQLPSGWLKDEATMNISIILVTLATFQPSSGWLNFVENLLGAAPYLTTSTRLAENPSLARSTCVASPSSPGRQTTAMKLGPASRRKSAASPTASPQVFTKASPQGPLFTWALGQSRPPLVDDTTFTLTLLNFDGEKWTTTRS